MEDLKMIKRVTKNHVEELKNIIKQKGYWCDEVKNYLSQFEFNAMCRLNDKAKKEVKNK